MTKNFDEKDRILEVSTTGGAAAGGIVMSNQSQMLLIIHDCVRSGIAQINVKIPLKRPRTSMSIKKARSDDTRAFLKRVMDKLKELKTLNVIDFRILKSASKVQSWVRCYLWTGYDNGSARFLPYKKRRCHTFIPLITL